MSIMTVIAVTAVAASGVAVLWALYAAHKREEYTRERFAFIAMAAFVAFCGTVASSIADKESPWTTIINLYRAVRGLPKETAEPRTVDHLLLLVLVGIVATLIYRIYRDWQGATSVQDFHRQQIQKRPLLLSDGLDEARRLVQQNPRGLHRQTAAESTFGQLDVPVDSLEWHIQALELVTLRNPGYRFRLDHDYYPEARSWVGEYPQLRKTVVLLCPQGTPTPPELEALLAFVNEFKGKALKPEELEVIVAVRQSVGRRSVVCSGVAVNVYDEQALLDDLVDFTDYFDYLQNKVEREPLPDSDKTIAMVYAPSRCTFESSNEEHLNVEVALTNWMHEPGQRQLALLGEYGQGKSTTALMFAHNTISASRRKPERVPILIELRGRSPRNSTPEGLLAEWAYRYSRVTPRAVMKLIVAGRAVVILEGFDEMALAGDAQARFAHFRTLWGFSYPRSKVLFTGRPNYFLDDKELIA